MKAGLITLRPWKVDVGIAMTVPTQVKYKQLDGEMVKRETMLAFRKRH